MKIQIHKNLLTNALRTCCNAMDSVSFNPINEAILIKTDNQEIHLQAITANTSLFIRLNKNIQIKEPGQALVKGKLLYNIISKIQSEEVTLQTVDNSVLRVEVPRFSSDINLFESTLFPTINFQFDSWKKVQIESSFVKGVINKLIPCATTTDNKNIACNNILFDTSKTQNQIEAIGTDGNHLAYIQKQYSGEQFKLIINIQNLKQINDFLNTPTLSLFINNKTLAIQSQDTTILIRTVEGQYPDLTKPLQSQPPHKIICKTNTLLNAVEKATLLASADKKPAIQFNILNNVLKITARSIEYGSTLEEIDINNPNTTTQTFTFNAKYLINLLKNIESDNVILEFSIANKPVLIKEKNNSNYISLLLPIVNL